MLDEGELLAPAQVHGNWYGAPSNRCEPPSHRARTCSSKSTCRELSQCDVGFPQAVFLFLAPPAPQNLVNRLGTRQTESKEDLARRIRDAESELAQFLTTTTA